MLLRLIIILLSFLNAGYMAFDGGRALIKGDYIRPSDGEYAGQLGPWTNIVSAAGIDPMSSLMKSIFLLFGIYGLISVVVFIFNPRPGRKLLLAFSILTLWNLMFGTLSSILVILVLLIQARKSAQ
jgi:hypothetical protein